MNKYYKSAKPPKWLSLKDRMALGLSHLTRGLDWRPLAKGTTMEGLPYTHSYMGRSLVMLHAYPELMETPGRYLTALALGLERDPHFSSGGVTGVRAAEKLTSYIAGKINASGKFVTTQKELDSINHPDQIFVDPALPHINKKNAATAKAGWYGKAGIEYNGHLSILMEGLVRWYMLTGDKKAKAAIDRAIRGRISDPRDMRKSKKDHISFGMVLPGLMTPLTLHYQHTGDPETKRYLDEVAKYFISDIYPRYFPDGKHAHGDGVGHLHCRMGGIAGFARYGALVGRSDYLAEAAELLTVNAQWGTEFGFMPERHVFAERGSSDTGHIYQPWILPDGKKVSFSMFTRPRCGWDTCEICVTADAIDAAIVLAQNGHEKFWDIAERYANHLFQTQITDTSFFQDRGEGPRTEVLGATFKHVLESVTGGFYSATTPTRAIVRQGYGKTLPDGRDGLREGAFYGVYCACCPGWGARTLALLWQQAVTENKRQVEVNFPFDRTTEKVEVTSGLPFAGTISVKARQTVDLLVRIPDWVEHDRAEVRINGQRQERVEFKNAFSDYVRVGRVQAGDRAEVSYPLRSEKKRYYIDYHPSLYEADWLGNSVMGLKEIGIAEPEGENSFKGIGKLYSF